MLTLIGLCRHHVLVIRSREDEVSGPSLEELGMAVEPTGVGGLPTWEIQDRAICVCGHRIAAHRGERRTCFGVPQGRRLVNAQSEVDCACTHMVPIIMVPDARPFRATYRSAMPEHPFTVGLIKLGLNRVEHWLVDVPLVCMNCGQVGGVRAAYWPGSRRAVSGMFCDGPRCAPVPNEG